MNKLLTSEEIGKLNDMLIDVKISKFNNEYNIISMVDGCITATRTKVLDVINYVYLKKIDTFKHNPNYYGDIDSEEDLYYREAYYIYKQIKDMSKLEKGNKELREDNRWRDAEEVHIPASLIGKDILVKLDGHPSPFIGKVDYRQVNDYYGVEVDGLIVGDCRYCKIDGVSFNLVNILDGKVRRITHWKPINAPQEEK